MVIIIARQQFTLTQKPFLMRKIQNFILPPPYNYRAKVRKNVKLLFSVLCAIMSITATVTAQSKLWLHGNKVINLSDSYNITVSDLPTPSGPAGLVYDGSMPTLTEHVEYDSNGNILFFMIDGKIYNKDGYLLVKNHQSPNGLYNSYPEKMIKFAIAKVPSHCDKFYLIGNYIPMGDVLPLDQPNPHFFISVLDLSLPNLFFPNDPDKSGALVNWNIPQTSYPIDLTEVPNLTNFNGGGVDIGGGVVVITLNTLVSQAAGNYPIIQFSIIQNANGEYLLNTAQFLRSFDWKLDSTGLKLIQQNMCNVGSNVFIYFYENRTLAHTSNGSIIIANGYRATSQPSVQILGASNYQSISCNTLSAGGTLTSELSSDGSMFYTYSPNGLKYHIATTQGAQEMSLPSIPSIANQNLWNKGCVFRRNIYQGVESIYVFHEGGIDVIKGTNNPLTAEYFPNVLSLSTPTMSEADLMGALLLTDPNFNYISELSGMAAATSFIVAPIQVYNRIDEVIPTSECCVFETNYNAEGNIIINSNQTWTTSNNPFNNSPGPIHISGDLIIQGGRSLTINNLEIRFAENSDVVVSPGAFLRIENNSKLTSYTCDGLMWRGIDLLSTPNLNQVISQTLAPGVGRVQINNSIIEHAIRGVEVGTTNNNAGGLIRTINATFLNCKVGVTFRAYTMMQHSSFENSKWITNQKLKDPSETLGSMVHLQGVKGTVRFRNCSFVNMAGWHEYDMNSRQTGIHCSNSSIFVDNVSNAAMPFVNSENIGRAFYRLKRGIVYSTTNTSTLSITKMAFDECNIGLQVTDAVGSIINDNEFDVPTTAAISSIKPRGSILTGCTAFSFERNKFSASQFNASAQNVGSMFVSCGVDNNLSYRNTYTNLWKGQEVQGNNANPLASIGLQLRCNTYTTCQFDQYLGDHAYWRNNQGDVTDVYWLANNRFSEQFPSCAADKYDMYISPIRSYGTWFFDYFVPNSEWYIPNSFEDTFTDCSSPHIQVVVPGEFEDNTNPIHTNICPTEPVPPINSNGLVLLQEKQDAVAAAKLNYQVIVDKNERQYLLNHIHAAFPQESAFIRDLLLQKTPLSDSVMKAFIYKLDLMDPWHLTQVLLANSPLTKDVLITLENSEILSGFFMNFIYQAQVEGALNLRKLLELEISARETDKHLAFIQLISQADSIQEPNELQDEYASLIEEYETEDMKKWQVEYYRSTNPTRSTEIFRSLTTNPELTDWATLKGIEWSIPDSTETIDSATVSLIEEIAFNPKSGGYPLALSLLEKYGYNAIVAEPEIPLNNRSMQPGNKKEFNITPIEFEAYPNPASANTFITYPKDADGIGYIEYWNNQGLLLKRELLTENGVKEINLENWSSGVYLLKLVVDDKQLGSLKVVKL